MQEAQDRYRALSELTSDFVFEARITPEGETVVQWVTEQFSAIMGYTLDEYNARGGMFALVHPDDAAGLRAFRQHVLENHSGEYEFRVIRQDGAVRWLRTTARPRWDENEKRVTHLYGAMNDITARKEAESRFREQEENYRRIFEAVGDGVALTDLEGNIVEVNPAFCEMHGFTRQELIGMSIRALAPSELDAEVDAYTQTLAKGQSFFTHGLAVRRDGSVFPVAVRGTRVIYRGAPHALGIVRDISAQVRALEWLEQRVGERTAELAALLDISHTVASTLELGPLLALILEQLKTLIDYRGAAIVMRENDALRMLDYRGPMTRAQAAAAYADLGSATLHQRVVAARQTVIVNDIYADTPEAAALRAWGGARLDTELAYLRAWMGVPLVLQERAVGMLAISHDQPHYFTLHHAQLAQIIANQAAIAMENARLYDQARRLAAVEERQRLARDLHDSVSQALYGIELGAQTARELLGDAESPLQEPIEYIQALAQAGLAEMRALIFDLRPEALANEGLVGGLKKQAAFLRARHRLDVRAQFCDEPDAPLPVKEALYRVAQEALHNIVKHARARTVDIALAQVDGTVTLEIRDDGIGFDVNRPYPGHLGLASMCERIAEQRGELAVTSAPGSGTHIRAALSTQTARVI